MENIVKGKREAKVRKVVEGSIVTFHDAKTNEVLLEIDIAQYPETILGAAEIHGILQWLGDSYAGEKGDAAACVAHAKAKHESMMKGELTVRIPSDAIKTSKKDIATKLASKTQAEQEAARKLLADLGIVL